MANFILILPEIILFSFANYYNLQLSIDDLSPKILNDFEFFCYMDHNCDKVLKFSQIVSKISFISSFLALYFMNKTFRNTFKQILKNLKLKKK